MVNELYPKITNAKLNKAMFRIGFTFFQEYQIPKTSSPVTNKAKNVAPVPNPNPNEFTKNRSVNAANLIKY
jgi:hypothetical protein